MPSQSPSRSLSPAAAASDALHGATLSWDITKACNLSCGHCSNADDRATAGRDLKQDEAAHMLAEFVNAGGTSLHMLGGEPLLRKDILNNVAVAHALGLNVSMTTNGTILPDRAAIEWLLAKLSVFTVSLDGKDAAINDSVRGAGTFAAATATLRTLRSTRDASNLRTRINVSHVLCRSNADSVSEMIDLASACGADQISITYLKPFGNALNPCAPKAASIDALFDALVAASMAAEHCQTEVTLYEVPRKVQDWLRARRFKKVNFAGDKYCDTGRGQLRASSDGRVFPCFAGTKQHREFELSLETLDIRRKPLDDIVDSDFYRRFERTAHEALADTPWKICRDCDYFSAHECYPGCPFEPENVKPRLCLSLSRAP